MIRRSLLVLPISVVGFLQFVTAREAQAGTAGIGAVRGITSLGIPLSVPVDGRIRGETFAAEVTGVAWPTSIRVGGHMYGLTPRQRPVVFSLEISEPTAIDPLDPSGPDSVTAAITDGTESSTVDLASIDSAMYYAPGPTSSGSATYLAMVPVPSTNVDLTLSEGGFSQSFDLWTLQRARPTPLALYRSIGVPPVSVTADSTAQLVVDDQRDHVEQPQSVGFQSVTLSYFSPASPAATAPSPQEAYLAVDMEADHAQGVGPANAFVSMFDPLQGSRVLLKLPGRKPIAASTLPIANPASDQVDPPDDGLLDATFEFVVPASLTTATLEIVPGPVAGYLLTYGETGSRTAMTVTSTVDVPFTIPPVSVSRRQPVPSWVTARTSPASSAQARHGGAFPLLPVVGGLGIAVLGFVVTDRRRARRARQAAVAEEAPRILDDAAPTDVATGPWSASCPTSDTLATGNGMVVGVLGPIVFYGWQQPPGRRILEELCCFLVLHDDRPRTAEEILVALWPTDAGRAEPDRRTLRTYMSLLRQAIGGEHLPDATPAGYLVRDVTCDWVRFREFFGRARDSEGAAKRDALAEALTLVRGEPFAGAAEGSYSWAFAEGTASAIAASVVACAHELCEALLDIGDHPGAVEACRRGLLASPHEELLFADLLRYAVEAGDPDAQRRTLQDAAAALGEEAAGRLRDQTRAH